MQKRRGHIVGLPMTESDLDRQFDKNDGSIVSPSEPTSWTNNNKRKRRIRIRRAEGSCNFKGMIVGCIIVLILIIGVTVLYSRHLSNNDSPQLGLVGQPAKGVVAPRIRPSGQLPLSKFKSLEYPLAHAKLVGLYFAASWCPMSTPVTEKLDEYFGDLLLPPPSPDSGMDSIISPQLQDEKSSLLSIVFVSSDRKEENFRKYIRRNWIAVPFDSPEKTALKKHFKVCSKPEVERLGINRKFEIPTLLILDGATHGILTSNGVEDLDEYGDEVLAHWMGLHDLVRALEHKYST